MTNEIKDAGVVLPTVRNSDQIAAMGIATVPYLESLDANVAARHINDVAAIYTVTERTPTRALAEPSASLAKELKEVTDLLPEKDRAAYVAGFLRHHDLLQEGKGDKVTYTPNPNEERPQPGNYVPAALVNRDRTPQ